MNLEIVGCALKDLARSSSITFPHDITRVYEEKLPNSLTRTEFIRNLCFLGFLAQGFHYDTLVSEVLRPRSASHVNTAQYPLRRPHLPQHRQLRPLHVPSPLLLVPPYPADPVPLQLHPPRHPSLLPPATLPHHRPPFLRRPIAILRPPRHYIWYLRFCEHTYPAG